jgi:hypothetical protein
MTSKVSTIAIAIRMRALSDRLFSQQNLKMFHPRAITAANNLIKLWSMKAAELKGEEFFESSDDLMVGRQETVHWAFVDLSCISSISPW